MATNTTRREPYIGEKQKFLRDGYGVYEYENKFFRYEGEWQKGKKHGHGKLIMKDGTYYEGQFVNGEINGHGFKFFASSNSTYNGQFLNGELHGLGIMQYGDNSVYEGQWERNKKQGFGVLRTSPVAVYEGQFQNHLKHGEGSQTYEGVHVMRNGDRYEGYWIMDKRHGHGELFCQDGSYYVGQFANDKFHGEGRMQHASGMFYTGHWKHGFPSHLATKLVLIAEESPLMLRQEQTFSIQVQCQDNDGNLIVEDEGREIQVSAGFKYYPPKEGSALFDMIEDVEEHPVPTPFGYDMVSYPLTDQPLEDASIELDKKGDKPSKEEEDEKGEEVEGQAADPEKEGRSEVRKVAESGVVADADSSQTMDFSKASQESSGILKVPLQPEVMSMPPPVAPVRTVRGEVHWSRLLLAPPPPMYRPFVAMEEEARKNKKFSVKEKLRDRKQNQTKVDNKDKADVTDEICARTGEYVLMVRDVTNPPFLGKQLEPAFLLLKVKKTKKLNPKKSKWDTQRHIVAAMQRSTGYVDP